MPWKPEDARKHKKGLSEPEAHKWSEIANHALTEYGDEATAIKVANSRTYAGRHTKR